MTADARVGRSIHLRHVKGQRGVPRHWHDLPATVLAVWHYHSGLIRFKVRTAANRVVWVSASQIRWLP